MAEPLRISLRYRGPEVDSGEMDINEVVEALQGFSGAYGKVASEVAPDSTHQLRVAAIRESSFDVFIIAAIYLSQHADVLKTIETVTDAAKYVFGMVTAVIGLKKHTKGQPYNVNVKGNNNTVVVLNSDNVELHVPLESFELFKSGLIDRDLNKIVAPLRPNSIEVAELRSEGEKPIEATITSAEREYFRPSSVVTMNENEIVGTLISLNKKTNRGTFEFGNDASVRYHYTGEDKDQFHKDFSRKGPVRVTAVVEFDENLTPLHLEIKRVEPLQSELKLTQ